MLNDDIFKIIIDSIPLVSIDILLKRGNKILLGRRLNSPAQGYFFSVGGRIKKDETINQALARIAKTELGIELKYLPKNYKCI
jgi:colanic acid biosynthesis protein WcaH